MATAALPALLLERADALLERVERSVDLGTLFPPFGGVKSRVFLSLRAGAVYQREQAGRERDVTVAARRGAGGIDDQLADGV